MDAPASHAERRSVVGGRGAAEDVFGVPAQWVGGAWEQGKFSYDEFRCGAECCVLIDRSHKRWGLATGVLFLLSGALYWFYAHLAAGGPRGGSLPGLAFGIAGSALMVFAGLIALRKRVPEWRIGSAQFWLRGHIWLGALSVPLILFHAGFRWGGLLEQLLLAVLAGVVASGAFGLVLQQVLPRQMTTRVPLETFYAQIPHVCDVLQVEGDVLVARLCGALAVAANLEVATDECLKRLGVHDRRPLGVVYAVLPDGQPAAAPVETAQMRAAKRVVKADAVATGPASAPALPAASFNPERGTHEVGLATVAPRPAVAAEPPPAKPLSPAEKIALMRAKKPPAKTEDSPADAAEPAAAAIEPAASFNAERGTHEVGLATVAPLPVAGAAPAPAKPLSPAEKIALMRAKKQSARVEDPLAGVAEPASAPVDAAAAPQARQPAAHGINSVLQAAAGGPAVATGAAPTASTSRTARAVATSAPVPRKQQVALDGAWKEFCPELRRFYLADVRPFLSRDFVRGDPLADEASADGRFALQRVRLPNELHEALDELSKLCGERRQLAAQARIHHWLHGWLFVHVPLSMALLGLGAVHVCRSVYY